MNIDYAKITESADNRRTVLQELEELLNGADTHVGHVAAAQVWVAQLSAVHRTLDDEWRKLLPGGIQTALTYVGTTSAHLANALNSNPAGNKNICNHGMEHLKCQS